MTDLDRILHDLAERGSAVAGASDPAEIRAAGDHRRRRRLATIVAAVVLVIFAGTAATGIVVSEDPRRQIPVTPANHPTTGPATPSPVEVHELAEDPFLEGPFSWPDSYRGLKRKDWKEGFRPFCLPALGDLGADEVRTATYAGQGEASVVSGAMEFESVEAAEAAVAGIRSLPKRCYESDDDTRDTIVHEPSDRNAGDEAFVFAWESLPNEKDLGTEPAYFGYGVVRDANIVVVIEFGAFGPPIQDKPYATWSDATLNDLIDKAVG